MLREDADYARQLEQLTPFNWLWLKFREAGGWLIPSRIDTRFVR